MIYKAILVELITHVCTVDATVKSCEKIPHFT